MNQILTKIDGVNALNNILLIGMTNRKDMLDEALLRPGRLEVQIEIGLPDENGRLQILQIKTKSASENSFIDKQVNLKGLAERTKNFSGAELEGLMKSATSFALNRHIADKKSGAKSPEELKDTNIRVTMADFENALLEVQPAFGARTDMLERCRLNGMISTGDAYEHLMKTCKTLVHQVRVSEKTPLLSILLEGEAQSGKTALAATLALESDFPFVKMVSAENMVGWSESYKCNALAKVFDDATKSPLSIILLDDIERLLDYVSIGPRFSNVVLQALLVLLKRIPPKGHKLLVIGTTSEANVLQEMAITSTFNVVLTTPLLSQNDIRRVLTEQRVFAEHEVSSAVALLPLQIGIKRLLMLLEMARQGGDDGEVGGDDGEQQCKQITFARFQECIRNLGGRGDDMY